MEMQTKIGNMLDVKTGLMVHGCNCIGVMGAGVALSVKNKWPKVFHCYRENFDNHPERPSTWYLGRIQTIWVDYNLAVVNAFTQDGIGMHKQQVDYDALYQCFEKVSALAMVDNLPVHFPLIGCGYAGGDWNIVKDIIQDTLDPSLERNLWILPQ
jgi:O-acetyl-ADP-ribose deacetylase (regulator of RNase III)